MQASSAGKPRVVLERMKALGLALGIYQINDVAFKIRENETPTQDQPEK